MNKPKHGQLLLSSTGTGKTFIAGALVRRLVDINFTKDKTFGATEYLYVTRASIVEQTKRVFENCFGLSIKDGVEILNIEQLRSRAGAVWIKEQVIVEGGEEKTVWKWRKMMNPPVVLLDESQGVKNPTSTQHQIMASFNDIPDDTYQVHISATPFTRVSEAKCFAVSTRKDITYINGIRSPFPEGATLSNETWQTYAGIIAYPSKPDEYNEAAVERLCKDLDQYIVRVRGVRPQFDAENSITMIHFETPEERKYYEDTEARYMRKKAKLAQDIASGAVAGGGGIWPLVLLNERCMAAELCRAAHIARRMYEAYKAGYAACCACKYKATMIKVMTILESKYGISRDLVSFVWGGGKTKLTKKQTAAINVKAKVDELTKAGMTVEEILDMLDITLEDLAEAEAKDELMANIPEHLRLGMQDKEERQNEIDRFQSGKTMFCMYTFKAGGVGLSLHHTDELTTRWDESKAGFAEWKQEIDKWNDAKVLDETAPEGVIRYRHKRDSEKVKPGKCRRKKNGYVYVEDIPFIPVRPRWNFVSPTYSAIELVQGLGRCPRLTSLSVTKQELLFYTGTVEVEVSVIVAGKLRCLTYIVRMRESWQDCITVGKEAVMAHLKNTEGKVDDPDEITGVEEGDDEE